jgi:hypothetical protein
MTMILWGCEDFFVSEVPYDHIQGSEPKLVVYSYVSAHKPLIQVYVGYSRSHVNPRKGTDILGDIKRVEMSDTDKQYHELLRDDKSGLYVIDHKTLSFLPGNIAHLRITTGKGITAHATCTIPIFEEVPQIEVDQPRAATTDRGAGMLSLGWTIKLPTTNVEKYYRIEPFMLIQEFRINIDSSPYDTIINVSDTTNYVLPLWLERGQEYFSHSGASQLVRHKAELWGEGIPDGKWHDEEAYNYQYDIYTNYSVTRRKRTLYLRLYETDMHYYKFHTSARNYFYYDDDMPFAESVRIYSNIEGGLGVFGGYSVIELNLSDILLGNN